MIDDFSILYSNLIETRYVREKFTTVYIGMEDSNDTCSLFFTSGICRVCDVIPSADFVIGVNGQNSVLSLVEAVFLSPRVFSALKTDRTIRFFEITDPQIDQDHFSDLIEIIHGRPVRLTASSRAALLRLARQLGNADLARMFFALRDDETVNQQCQSSVGFDLTLRRRKELFLLDADTLDHILSSDELRIESEDWLLELILELGDTYRALLSHVRCEFLSVDGLSKFLGHFHYWDMTAEIWSGLVRRLRGENPSGGNRARYLHRAFPSSIVSGFPAVLSVIEEKNVRLWYQGTRDGFTAANCHPQVAGRSNLLILVETTGGWIFGGYAHCKWPECGWERDPSLKSFLFTLKNPHNIPPRRFEMRKSDQDYVLALSGSPAYLVWMGWMGAIALAPACNENATSNNLGFADSNQTSTFENDSGHDGKTLFTGSERYTVKEVEIFEFFD
jgi:hypothetical protein